MPEYKVTRVSSQEPRSWSFSDKKTGEPVYMETYRVMLEGVSDAVEVNRKPGNRPTIGELLNGTVESTEYGYRFKSAPKPRPGFTPKDNTEIRAQMAVKAAANLVSHTDGWVMDDVEKAATALYGMVDRVKATMVATMQPQSGYEKAKAQAQTIKERQTFSDGSPVPTEPVDKVFPVQGEEKIDLSEIPF